MIGTILEGRYRIVRKLGAGGMGDVYEAQHTATGRRVAVKVILEMLAADDGTLLRFEREARAAGAIESEHVAHVLDFGRDSATGLSFLAMEFLEGEDLGQLSDRLGPVEPQLAMCMIAQVCAGLQKAHAASVVHRDIKPGNIFAARKDEGGITIKVLDFGIAKVKASTTAPIRDLTKTSSMLGTPLYMSPEQARGAKDVDPRTDIWSVGVVLHKLLSGHVPNEAAESINELIFMLITNPAPPLQDLAPWVPSEIAAIVHKALQGDREKRFQTAAEMLDAIKPHLRDGRAITQAMMVPLSQETRETIAPRLRVTVDRLKGRVSDFAKDATHVASLEARPPSATTAAPLSAPTTARATTTNASSWGAGANNAATTTGGGTVGTPPRKSTLAFAAAGVIALALAGVLGWRLSVSRPGNVETQPLASASGATASAGASAVIDDGRLESFGALPTIVTTPANPISDAKIALGRMLFFDARLSKSHTVSCTSCHALDAYGVDGKKVSTGDSQQVGTRNALSVYDSAGFFALMWDGRAASIEEQAALPLVNPVEMNATPKSVEATLAAIPAYVAAFAQAFPGEKSPLSFDNTTRAIAAFERKLFAPSRWEKFLEGEKSALTDAEKVGFNTFVDVGCPSCHFGPYVGATMFQKLGLVKAWPNPHDRGRFELTQRNEDFMVFRVPSLRNVVMTGPYFHDGSISSLDEVVRMMARYQVGKELSDAQVQAIIAWLGSLTGELPRDYIQKPNLPEGGPSTH